MDCKIARLTDNEKWQVEIECKTFATIMAALIAKMDNKDLKEEYEGKMMKMTDLAAYIVESAFATYVETKSDEFNGRNNKD